MEGGAMVQPFSRPAAIHSMLQIPDAVSYIHTQKMVHRGLKASNILINPVDPPGDAGDGEFVFAKVADFGLAKVKREITRYSHLTHNVGTRKWMAPEIFGANIDDDHPDMAYPMKSDVYSFGIVCFEILSGEEPFSDMKSDVYSFGIVCFEILSGEEPFSDMRAADLYSKLSVTISFAATTTFELPHKLGFGDICACWDADPWKRPGFADVCRVLRYLKGLPILIDSNGRELVLIGGEWAFGRLTAMVKVNEACLQLLSRPGEFCIDILLYTMEIGVDFRRSRDPGVHEIFLRSWNGDLPDVFTALAIEVVPNIVGCSQDYLESGD